MHPDNDDTAFGDLYDLATVQQKSPVPAPPSKHASVETVVYKRTGTLDLHADIYFPKELTTTKRPIGKDL